MKFSITAILLSAGFISQAVASPATAVAPAAAQTTCVLHCPGGYRCCGPLIVGVGGTCHWYLPPLNQPQGYLLPMKEF
ncbi:hypothetical protein CVT26_002535 [Gymnopilus dilepis]|uniref:Hydrophobin n=1 Tax=Gymnopilus dilepis TaxID=231916 RepID=A0A409VSY6_9AGAR|nr:hypothetical protein CVT26_002535 [Gymnopilus dilepis]